MIILGDDLDDVEAAGANVAVVFAQRVVKNDGFHWLVTVAILIASITQGISANRIADDGTPSADALHGIEFVIAIIFIVEALLKIVAEGSRPQRYFRDSWNVFDFVIVMLTIFGLAGLDVPAVSMLRLLRLLKLVKAYPALHVAVQSLLRAVRQVIWVGVIIGLLDFNFAVVGLQLFKRNDPGRFGTLSSAMVTVWGVSTLDGWEDALYTNMFRGRAGNLAAPPRRPRGSGRGRGGAAAATEIVRGRVAAAAAARRRFESLPE